MKANRLIRAAALSLTCSLLLAAAYTGSRERIADNQRHHREAVLREMLGSLGQVVLQPVKGGFVAYSLVPESLVSGSLASEPLSSEPLSSEPLSAEPLPAEGLPTEGHERLAMIRRVRAAGGYNGPIDLWLATTPDLRVIAVSVIDHDETPGLGDAIESPDWLAQFTGHYITTSTKTASTKTASAKNEGTADQASWRLTQAGGDFDGITGATITARAVVRAIGSVNDSVDGNVDGSADAESLGKQTP